MAKNIAQILRLLEHGQARDCKIIFLPENALFLKISKGSPLIVFDQDHPALRALQDWSQKFSVALHLGSVPWKNPSGGLPLNASVLIDPAQGVLQTYAKIHLFDVDIPGAQRIAESESFARGTEPQVLQYADWLWGQTICYDVRFADLFNFYARNQVDALLVPSAFLPETGRVHWHTLLKARAIESQCYLVAAAQGGLHESAVGRRSTYGHSLIIDPWGEILAEGSADQPALLTAALSRARLEEVRQQMPMSFHRTAKSLS